MIDWNWQVGVSQLSLRPTVADALLALGLFGLLLLAVALGGRYKQ